jgi:hypothetical protein
MDTVGASVDVVDRMDSERVDRPQDCGDCNVICSPSEILTFRQESQKSEGSLRLEGLGLTVEEKNPNDVKPNEPNDLASPLVPSPIRRGRFLIWPVTSVETNKVPPSSRVQ